MRNYSNIFLIVFSLFVFNTADAQFTIPYFNDFEDGADGWTSYAIEGTNEWELAAPDGWYIDDTYSGEMAWITNADGSIEANAITALESPNFDLSSSNKPLILAFRSQFYFPNNGFGLVEYSLDNGSTWANLNSDTALSTNWYDDMDGFDGNNTNWSTYLSYKYSLVDFAGATQIKFRFVLNNSNGTETREGWAIDDFEVRREIINVSPDEKQVIEDYSILIPDYEIDKRMRILCDFYYQKEMTTEAYFSKDTILDGSDSLIWTKTSLQSTAQSIEFTFLTPSTLNVGTYYILYAGDVNNTLDEINEADNIGIVEIQVDSTIVMGTVRNNWEEAESREIWEPRSENSGFPVLWEYGSAEDIQIEGTHSGDHAAYISQPAVSGNSEKEYYLYSPYLDFSNSQNNYVCFWYQVFTDYKSNLPNFSLELSKSDRFHISWASNNSNIENLDIPFPRTKDWDCTCQDISFLDNQFNSKMRFRFDQYAHFSGYVDQINIDDIYIGQALPDLVLDDKKERYFSMGSGEKVLNYRLFNAGALSAPASTSRFYWSTDNVLDAGDVLLGTKPEAAIDDTTFVDAQFVFDLPTSTPGEYYLLYQLDVEEEMAEMWEENNTGSIQVIVEPKVNAPYYNDFESNADNWSHYSTAGADDWEWAEPNGAIIKEAFSGQKGWITQADGIITPESRMHLVSPAFDLSSMDNPVLEFDLYMDSDGSPCGCYNANMNMTYSIDGGYNWILLDTTNQSFKHWYSGKSYVGWSGKDVTEYNEVQSIVLDDVREPTFHRKNTYQGRDVKRNYHYVLDLDFLKQYPEVKFRYNLGTDDRNFLNEDREGALIDNFSIQEAKTDLVMDQDKVIFIAANSPEIKFNVQVYNDGNYYAPQSELKFYLSNDEELSADDVLLAEESVELIQPEYIAFANFKYTSPANLSDYQYLIYHIDASEIVEEVDEENNIGVYPLIFQGINQLPYIEQFEEDYVYGWNNYSIYLGAHQRSHSRIRNKLAPVEAFYALTKDGEMKSDRPSNFSTSAYPFQYLETPIFDFSDYSSANISFDMLCTGRTSIGEYDGGTLQYSLDGGQSWQLLTKQQNTFSENWFNAWGTQIWSGPDASYGWSEVGFNHGYSGDYLTHRELDISHLMGNAAVQFRFKYGSNWSHYGFGSGQGFKLDNFEILGKSSDYYLTNITPEITSDVNVDIGIEFTIHHTGSDISRNSIAYCYLSTDENFDPIQDELVADFEISSGYTNSSKQINEVISIEADILQNEYFLFVKIDGPEALPETNEDNNVDKIRLIFNDHLNYSAATGIELITSFQDQISIDYEIRNWSTLPGANSTTKFYWSTNTTLDAADIYLGEKEEAGLSPNEIISNQFIFPQQSITQRFAYLLYELDSNNELLESNEDDNLGIITLDMKFVEDELPSVQGKFYYDENENQSFDIDEITFGGQSMNLMPNNLTSFSDYDGRYYYFLNNGNYELQPAAIEYWKFTGPNTIPLTINDDNFVHNIGFVPEIDSLSFHLDIASGPTRCSRIVPFWVSVKNTGTRRADVLLKLELTAPLEWVDAAIAPDSISGQQYFWRIDAVAPFQNFDHKIQVNIQMPDESYTGEFMQLNASLLAEDNFNTNELFLEKEFESELRCSFDPNDKLVQPERGDENYTLFEEELEYTIRFQNTGNDTAFLVTLKDTLSDLLDWNTFRPISASHGFDVLFDRANGELTFTFENINLPDSTTNPTGSQGFVKYAIFSKTGLDENVVVNNSAGIYFDFNAPIITNTTSNQMVSMLPTGTQELRHINKLQIFPNPNVGRFIIALDQVPENTLTVEVRTALGELVHQSNWPKGQSNFSYNMESFAAGVYFIHLIDARNRTAFARGKISLQKKH